MTRRSDRLPEELPDLPVPAAVQYLNYPGIVRIPIGTVMGPMLEPADQMLTVVSGEYDSRLCETRLGLTYGDLSHLVGGAA